MIVSIFRLCLFFFQAEDGIRDIGVTGVQTCALPICAAGLGLADDVQLLVADRHPQAGEVEVRGARHLAQPEAVDVERARAPFVRHEQAAVVDAPWRAHVAPGPSAATVSTTHRPKYSKWARSAAAVRSGSRARSASRMGRCDSAIAPRSP